MSVIKKSSRKIVNEIFMSWDMNHTSDISTEDATDLLNDFTHAIIEAEARGMREAAKLVELHRIATYERLEAVHVINAAADELEKS